jgi:putative chitinase
MAMNRAFFDAVRSTMADGKLTQHQVDVFNQIGWAWDRYGDKLGYDQYRLAYVLATAWHETGRFKWLREIWGPTPAQKRYEGRADLGNNAAGDGKKFMGRGLVHITGRRNYTDWSRRLGIDLLKKPALAEEMPIAARILVEGMVKGTFTGKKLLDYINSDQCDFVGARRIVNGTDKAALIAGYAEKFSAALGLADSAAPAPSPAPAPKPAPTPPQSPPQRERQAMNGFAAFIFIIILLAILAGLFVVRF